MKISLVIPAYNEEGYIGQCISSVLKNAPGKFHEIIVVDNASSDKTNDIASKFSGVRVVHEPNKGLTRARQRGLEEASGDIIAYIDADSLLPDGWVSRLEKIYSKNNKIVCVSGPYRYYDGPWWKNQIMHGIWWLVGPTTYRMVGFMVLGGNFAAKRQALIDMGGFDKTIDFFGEDTDIARRLNKHGKVLFNMSFFIYSSSRRYISDGLIKTSWVYVINFLWPVIFHKPFTKKYKDIRLK